MGERCRVNDDFNRWDSLTDREDWLYGEHRELSIELAELVAKGVDKIKDEYGRPFTNDDFSVVVFEHDKFPSALLEMRLGNHKEMDNLIKHCAYRAAAIHLFGEDRADELFPAKDIGDY